MPTNDRGWMRADPPRIRSTLNRLEPMMLPNASWPFFLTAAATQVASSGMEVPPARMVMAMNLSLTPSALAMAVAESTKRLPPRMSAPRPPRIITMESHSLRSFCGSSGAGESSAFWRKLCHMYRMKKASRMPPSRRERPSVPKPKRVFSSPSAMRSTVMRMFTGMSLRRLSRVMGMGSSTAVRPRMSRVLKMLDPTTLPMAISAFPCEAPMKLTTISGADVPIPTIVRPITNSLSPKRRATADAPSTR